MYSCSTIHSHHMCPSTHQFIHLVTHSFILNSHVFNRPMHAFTHSIHSFIAKFLKTSSCLRSSTCMLPFTHVPTHSVIELHFHIIHASTSIYSLLLYHAITYQLVCLLTHSFILAYIYISINRLGQSFILTEWESSDPSHLAVGTTCYYIFLKLYFDVVKIMKEIVKSRPNGVWANSRGVRRTYYLRWLNLSHPSHG